MLPLQCPVNVTLSHATELSVRAGTTALSVVGDALGSMLQRISNQATGWAPDPLAGAPDSPIAAQPTAGMSNTLWGAVTVGAIVVAGAVKVWQYQRAGRRLAQARADLAAQPAQPVPDPRVDALVDQARLDQAFAAGATAGYRDADAGRTGPLIEIAGSGEMTDAVRYFRSGYSLGFESARSYRAIAEDSA